jgi:hypothetical protein
VWALFLEFADSSFFFSFFELRLLFICFGRFELIGRERKTFLKEGRTVEDTTRAAGWGLHSLDQSRRDFQHP